MRKRILSTVFLWTFIALVLCTYGVWGGFMLLVVLSALTQYELYQLMEKFGWRPYKIAAIAIGIVMLCGCFGQSEGLFDLDYILVSVSVSVIVLGLILVTSGKPEDIKSAFLPTIFGIIYVPVMFCFPLLLIKKLAWTSGITLPIVLILWIIVVAKFSDVGGLIVGSTLGKHKLASSFSPKKTYEGLLGSLIFSMIAGCIFALCCGRSWPSKFSFPKICSVSAILSIVALISDLIESGFKRLANVKDSGATIPGIGGIFDLTDSLILTLPLGVIILKEFILI